MTCASAWNLNENGNVTAIAANVESTYSGISAIMMVCSKQTHKEEGQPPLIGNTS